MLRVERIEDLPAYVQEQVRRVHPELLPGGRRPKGETRYHVAPVEQRTLGDLVFGSKRERVLFERLEPTLAPDERLAVHVRWPLLSLVPRAGKCPSYLSVDFSILRVSGERVVLAEVYDAKPRGKAGRSAEWKRGAAAFASTYGFPVVEVSDPVRFVRERRIACG